MAWTRTNRSITTAYWKQHSDVGWVLHEFPSRFQEHPPPWLSVPSAPEVLGAYKSPHLSGVVCFRHVGDGITVCVSTLQGFHLIVTVFAKDQTRCPTKLRAHQVRFQVHRRLNINFISMVFFNPTCSMFDSFLIWLVNWAVVDFLPIFEVSPLPYPAEVQCQVCHGSKCLLQLLPRKLLCHPGVIVSSGWWNGRNCTALQS